MFDVINVTSVFDAEVWTDSSPSDTFGSAGVMAGVAAALVLLLALVVVALYVSCHSTSVSPFYLIQVSTGLSTSTRFQQMMFSFKHRAFLSPSSLFYLATQEPFAILEVSEATARLLRSGGRPRKRQYC